MTAMKTPTGFWALIWANYTPEELQALKLWADELVSLTIRKGRP